MRISETKKQIVIDNYFKNTCDVNTSIKEAFTKGFEVGLTKAVFPKEQYESRLKADIGEILDEIRVEIGQFAYAHCSGDDIKIYDVFKIIDKYKAESEDK